MSHPSLPASRLVAPVLLLSLVFLITVQHSAAQTGLWATHSHDAQHTGVSSVAAQPFNQIHWQVPVDLNPPTGVIFIHYGSPLVTAENTVIVPVKTGPDSFRVEAHKGATGDLLWRQSTGYNAPFAGFLPGLGPTLYGDKLLIPDSAGRVLVRKNPNLAKGAVSRLYFYG